jgi:hypothetical protein
MQLIKHTVIVSNTSNTFFIFQEIDLAVYKIKVYYLNNIYYFVFNQLK